MAVAFLLLRPSRFETRPSRSSSVCVSKRDCRVLATVAFRNATVALTGGRVSSSTVSFFDRLVSKRDSRSFFETRPSRSSSSTVSFRNATVSFVSFRNATVFSKRESRFFFFDRRVSKRDCRVNVVVAFLLRPSRFETRPSRSSSSKRDSFR